MKLHLCLIAFVVALSVPAASNADFILDDYTTGLGTSYSAGVSGTRTIGGFTVTRNLTSFAQNGADSVIFESNDPDIPSFPRPTGSIEYVVAGGTFRDVDGGAGTPIPASAMLNSLKTRVSIFNPFNFKIFVDDVSVYDSAAVDGLFVEEPILTLNDASKLRLDFVRTTAVASNVVLGGPNLGDKLVLTPEPTSLLLFSFFGLSFCRRRRS